MTKIINKKMKEKIQFTIIILHSSFDSKQLLKNLGGGSDLYLFLSLSESLAKIISPTANGVQNGDTSHIFQKSGSGSIFRFQKFI